MLQIQLTLSEREAEFFTILQKIERVVRREDIFIVSLKEMVREKKYLFEWMRERDIPISIPSEKIEPLKKSSIYTDCSILMLKEGKLNIECYTVSFDDSEPEEPFYWQINRCFFEPIDCDIDYLLSMKVKDEEAFQAFLSYYRSL
jgi:hypothetical protein